MTIRIDFKHSAEVVRFSHRLYTPCKGAHNASPIFSEWLYNHPSTRTQVPFLLTCNNQRGTRHVTIEARPRVIIPLVSAPGLLCPTSPKGSYSSHQKGRVGPAHTGSMVVRKALGLQLQRTGPYTAEASTFTGPHIVSLRSTRGGTILFHIFHNHQ